MNALKIALWPEIDLAAVRVSLLEDERGIYGVGLTIGDAIVCTQDFTGQNCAPGIFLRGQSPFMDRGQSPVLQPIPPGRGWQNSAEYQLADALLTCMLARSGIKRDSPEQGWWSRSKAEQAKNRRRYFAFRRGARAIVNGLIRQALAAAPAEPLRVARRFPHRHRYDVYRAVIESPRLLQTAEIFPALLLTQATRNPAKAAEARRMVERGAKLNTIAAFANIPMAFRKCRPGAVDLAAGLIIRSRDEDFDIDLGRLVHMFLPATTQGQRRWFGAVTGALPLCGPYVEWVARHALKLGATRVATEATVSDIGDWVRASYASRIPKHALRALGRDLRLGGLRHVTRPFSPDVSVRTVLDLSGAWHEAVVLDESAAYARLPAPWRDSEMVAGLTIAPLATAAEIAAEGRAMHHCARSYITNVASGYCYLFSVRQGEERLATIEVQRKDADRVAISQMRGHCNALLPERLQSTLRRWAGQQSKWRKPSPPERCAPGGIAAYAFDDDIPF